MQVANPFKTVFLSLEYLPAILPDWPARRKSDVWAFLKLRILKGCRPAYCGIRIAGQGIRRTEKFFCAKRPGRCYKTGWPLRVCNKTPPDAFFIKRQTAGNAIISTFIKGI